MRLIIAGSRSITDASIVQEAFEESSFEWDDVSVLVNGKADGVDEIAEALAREMGVVVEPFPADAFLDEAPNPRVAPILRNQAMAENADALLAVWDGESSGTENMISEAEKEGLEVEVHRTDTFSLSDF